MKVYMVTDKDIELLLSAVKEDPHNGILPTVEDRQVYINAHRFYNYRIHRWLDGIRKGDSDA